MALKQYEENDFQQLANIIRNSHFFSDTYKVNDMADCIELMAQYYSAMFEGCTYYDPVKIPNNIETLGEYALYGLGPIPRITIPEGIKYFKAYCLSGFGNKGNFGMSIVLPTSTIFIDPTALQNDNFGSIYVPWSEGEIEGAPWGAVNATIHYNYHNDI